MRSDDNRPGEWRLADDVDEFLCHAGDFLCSQPALHTVALKVTDELRRRGPYTYGPRVPVFGVLERSGAVTVAFFRTEH